MVSVGQHICVVFMGFVLLSPGGCIEDAGPSMSP